MRIKKMLTIVSGLLPVVLFAGCDVKQPPERTQRNTGAVEVIDAVDLRAAKRLHDANCISCHDSGKYAAGVRDAADFSALLAQVQRCNANLNPGLDAKEIVQIADYLNQTFYQYEKP